MTNETARAATGEPQRREITRAREIGLDLSLERRGGLDLERDSAQHRRFAWLYDDLLS